jgi:hypothetical protein
VTGRRERMAAEWARVHTRRCSWTEPTGWRCRSAPASGSDRCLLHREVAAPPDADNFSPAGSSDDALTRPASTCEHNPDGPACLRCHTKGHTT